MKFTSALLGMLSALSLGFTSEIEVVGQCLDHGMSYYEYRFSLRYTNSELEAGSRVEIFKSFSGHGSFNGGPYQEEWTGVDDEVLELSVQNGIYSINVPLYFMATGGYLSGLDFHFKITRPDGSVTWDNGTDDCGCNSDRFYRTKFFVLGDMECWHLRNPTSLEVERIGP